MSYREGQFHIKQTPHPQTPGSPPPPVPPYQPTPSSHHPLAEFCVQFWSLFHEQDHLVLSNDRQMKQPKYQQPVSINQ